MKDLYHHDAEDAHGGFSAGLADDFIDQLAATRAYLRSMQHHVTTVNFAISGLAAEGEIYTIAIHTLIAGDRDVDVVVGGRIGHPITRDTPRGSPDTNDPSHQFFSLLRSS